MAGLDWIGPLSVLLIGATVALVILCRIGSSLQAEGNLSRAETAEILVWVGGGIFTGRWLTALVSAVEQHASYFFIGEASCFIPVLSLQIWKRYIIDKPRGRKGRARRRTADKPAKQKAGASIVFAFLSWLARIGDNLRLFSQRLDASDIAVLQAWYSKELLEKIRIIESGLICWYLRVLARQGSWALPPFIFLGRDRRSFTVPFWRLLAHEMKHVEQQQRMGLAKFYWAYMRDLARAGFKFSRDLLLELEAYEIQREVQRSLPPTNSEVSSA